jgi:hypothetical protein
MHRPIAKSMTIEAQVPRDLNIGRDWLRCSEARASDRDPAQN